MKRCEWRAEIGNAMHAFLAGAGFNLMKPLRALALFAPRIFVPLNALQIKIREIAVLSKRNPKHKVFQYLLRKLVINRGNQVWALDTTYTYIRMARGFVCLTAVVDVYSRRILAHRIAITLEAVHAVDALEEAYARFGKPAKTLRNTSLVQR